MGQIVEFECPDGSTAEGYLASVAGARAIVLLQEWWGLNEQMKGVAERCAEAGYSALVPDLYHGRVTQDPDEANHLMTGLDWVGATHQEVRAAARYLGREADAVAVMGYCMGGALSLIAAAHLTEIQAAVCYYGIPPQDQADPAEFRVPVQAHFASRDHWCTPEAVDELEKQVAVAGCDVELHRYEAEHGFFNDAEPHVYDRVCAEQSWTRVLDFLERRLGAGGASS